MIIKFSQTASDISQSYYIQGGSVFSNADSGSFSRLQPIILSGDGNTIKGVYCIPNWVNFIPFRYIFGKENITRVFRLYRNGCEYGSIAFSKRGFLKSCYVITLDSCGVLLCYCRTKGSFDYVSIYRGDRQIALIETYLSVNDYKYTHKLYLLNDCRCFADVLSFFVIYYASYTFAQRFHLSKGSVSVKSWSFSRYNDKYDPKWRQSNFPDEDYFGKTSYLI